MYKSLWNALNALPHMCGKWNSKKVPWFYFSFQLLVFKAYTQSNLISLSLSILFDNSFEFKGYKRLWSKANGNSRKGFQSYHRNISETWSSPNQHTCYGVKGIHLNWFKYPITYKRTICKQFFCYWSTIPCVTDRHNYVYLDQLCSQQ